MIHQEAATKFHGRRVILGPMNGPILSGPGHNYMGVN